MAFENFPYTNFHEINLDWIVAKVKEAYSASNPPDYPVKSVNGMTGDVIIAIPANLVSSVNGETGDVILYRNPLVQFPTTDESRWNLFRICDGDERGIEFDEDGAKRIEGTRRILIYDEENQPDFPVTSVNGQTGDVRIVAGVNSVNGKTGNVVTPFVNPNSDILKLDSNSNTVLWGLARDVAGGEVALYITRGTGTPQAFIRYTPTDGEAVNMPLLTSADIPQEAGVVSVNTKTGAVTLYGTDILTSENSTTTITQDIAAEKAIREAFQASAEFDIDCIIDSLFTKEAGVGAEWARLKVDLTTGESAYNAYNITQRNYLNSRFDIVKSSIANQAMYILAWDAEETYIGIYDKTTKTFAPAEATGDNNICSAINLAELKTLFPSYKFKISSLYRNNTQIYAGDAVNLDFYTAAAGADYSQQIAALQANDATQDQEISALQAADTTHDNQISALQTSDTTQNQQISALQAADSGHNQQISALQAEDVTHNQQISALQASQATQDQQISELYTRTGIYVVSISNVNALPLRYPTSGTDEKIKATNKVVSMDLSIPGAQTSDWTITTYDGYLEITGTITGSSDITLYLA